MNMNMNMNMNTKLANDLDMDLLRQLSEELREPMCVVSDGNWGSFGYVVSIADGIVKISGLANAGYALALISKFLAKY
jgi:hypothetical protein